MREERAVKKLEILVVEDEPKLAQTISDFLTIQNYDVEKKLTETLPWNTFGRISRG